MFSSNRYLTKGVQAEIPLVLQIFMWQCINELCVSKDYLQVFELSNDNDTQKIIHICHSLFSTVLIAHLLIIRLYDIILIVIICKFKIRR